ncbi:FAD/NAD(P)-binding protein [Leucobacter luti]|uniref:FAD/NAD(P)-binding protein n=1 Tax=Leucobacter luti TaxID=340320 RepID=UPI003D08A230
MPEAHRASIAIIGAGPRGTSLIERIGAHLTEPGAPLLGRGIDLHVIDDAPSGAGRIWRADQDRELCMNTLSHAVTLFTEERSTVAGPVRVGPTLYEWSVLVLAGGGSGVDGVESIPPEHVRAFRSHPVRPGLAAEYLDELRETRPESHPSRALYGEYLAWCFSRAIAGLPAGVRVIRHRDRAVGVARVGGAVVRGAEVSGAVRGAERIELASGEVVLADAVILAGGWLPRAQSGAEARLAGALDSATAEDPRSTLVWVRQGSPADQDLSGIRPGADVIVRGLGMGFFDTMALLTIGRGGRFVTDERAPGRLRYEPSGKEPRIHATSGRGVPFRAKSLFGGLPPRPEQRFLRGVDWERAPRPIDFDRELWPRIVADAFVDHAETLRRMRPRAVSGTSGELLAALERAIGPIVAGPAGPCPVATIDAAATAAARFVRDPLDRFDLAGEVQPAQRSFTSPRRFSEWLLTRVADDLAEAELGQDSPVKAGLWSISTARAVANRIGTLGGFDAESRGSGFRLLHAIGAMAGSGPPAFRNRQLLALAEAGIVSFIGPEPEVTVGADGFRASSPLVAGSGVTAEGLIDAWMHFHDVSRTTDPLVRGLIAAGRARPFAIRSRSGALEPTRSFDIDGASGRLRGADGSLDPAVHVAGIPVDDALHDTIISPMPGTDPPMLRETDRVALSALRVACASVEAAGEAGETSAPAAAPGDRIEERTSA